MAAQDDGYNAWGTQQSKWAIGAFTVTCIFIALVKDWGFGLWWLVIWPIGIFAISLAAAPFSIGEWFARRKGLTWLALMLGIIHTLGSFPATYYALKLLHRELF